MSDLSNKIEALLFSEGGALPKKRLASLLSVKPEELQSALATLAERKKGSGLTLIETDQDVTLAIAPEESETITKVFERELGKEIGDAGLEVLAILLYRGPSTRAQIDYIRGVNTAWTVRMLAARGLVERAQNPADAREYLYRPTTDLLAHLGVTGKESLPEYAKIASELAAFEQQAKESGPFDEHAQGSTPSEGQ